MPVRSRGIDMRIRKLPRGSPEAAQRDALLATMRDETRPDEERDRATIAALPLCHEELPPIVVDTRNTKPKKKRSSRMASHGPKTLA